MAPRPPLPCPGWPAAPNLGASCRGLRDRRDRTPHILRCRFLLPRFLAAELPQGLVQRVARQALVDQLGRELGAITVQLTRDRAQAPQQARGHRERRLDLLALTREHVRGHVRLVPCHRVRSLVTLLQCSPDYRPRSRITLLIGQSPANREPTQAAGPPAGRSSAYPPTARDAIPLPRHPRRPVAPPPRRSPAIVATSAPAARAARRR